MEEPTVAQPGVVESAGEQAEEKKVEAEAEPASSSAEPASSSAAAWDASWDASWHGWSWHSWKEDSDRQEWKPPSAWDTASWHDDGWQDDSWGSWKSPTREAGSKPKGGWMNKLVPLLSSLIDQDRSSKTWRDKTAEVIVAVLNQDWREATRLAEWTLGCNSERKLPSNTSTPKPL